jgi:phosphoribosylaminoimidazole (AIR) synthetase
MVVGDFLLLGLPSSSADLLLLHSNGFSLVRKCVEKEDLAWTYMTNGRSKSAREWSDLCIISCTIAYFSGTCGDNLFSVFESCRAN